MPPPHNAPDFNLCDLGPQELAKKCEDIEELLKSSEDPSAPLSGVIMFLDMVLGMTVVDYEEHHKTFVHTTLPRLVVAVLQRMVLRDTHGSVSSFFELTLRLVVQAIQRQDPSEELYTMLDLILTPTCHLYVRAIDTRSPLAEGGAGKENKAERWDAAGTNFLFCVPAKQAHQTSLYFIKNLNLFGQKGGFLSCLGWIESGQPPTPTLLKRLLKPIRNAIDYLNPRFLADFVPRLTDAVFKYLLHLEADAVKNERDAFLAVVATVRVLLSKVHAKDYNEILENFWLKFYLNSFSSPLLEMRAQAVNGIRQLYKDALDKESVASGWRPNAGARFLTTKAILKWIDDNRIVDKVFSNPHPEVISRSVQLLIYMTQESRLLPSHIDAMWAAAEGQYEAVQQLIYNQVILELIPHLDSGLVNYIFEKARSIPKGKLDATLLGFLQSFTLRALQYHQARVSPKKRKLYGLEVLYDAIQQGSGADKAVQQKAFETLVAMLRTPDCEGHRKRFMKMCCENVRQGKSVTQSLCLLSDIIDMYDPTNRRKKKGTIGYVIHSLNEKQRLLDLFFEDLARFKAGKHRLAPEAAQQQWDDYGTQVGVRLAFLTYLLTRSCITLTFEHASKLWDAFYTNGLVLEERESCLNWFEDARSYTRKDIVAFSDEVTERIYQGKLLALDPRTMTLAAFRLFQTFFLYVNLRKGKLDIKRSVEEDEPDDLSSSAGSSPPSVANGLSSAAPNGTTAGASNTPRLSQTSLAVPPIAGPRSSMQHSKKAKKAPGNPYLDTEGLRFSELREECLCVVENDLLGIDQLWRIVTQCADGQVCSACIRFLNKLRLENWNMNEAQVGEMRRAHVDDCYAMLNRALAEYTAGKGKADEAAVAIERCIELLTDFLALCGPGPDASTVRGAQPVMVHVVVGQWEPVGANPTERPDAEGPPPRMLRLHMKSSDTAMRLRHLISADCDHPASCFRLLVAREVEAEEWAGRARKVARPRSTDSGRLSGPEHLFFPASFAAPAAGGEERQVHYVYRELHGEEDKKSLEELGIQTRDTVLVLKRHPAFECLSLAFGGVGVAGVSTHLVHKYVAGHLRRALLERARSVALEAEAQEQRDKLIDVAGLLATDPYFKPLFALLDLAPRVADPAWRFINRLPQNETITQQLLGLAKDAGEAALDWPALLQAGSLYKQLYALRIVDSLRQRKGECGTWNKRFVGNGGFAYLVRQLQQHATPTPASVVPLEVHYQCLVLLLHVLTYYLPYAYPAPTETCGEELVALARCSLRAMHVAAWQPRDLQAQLGLGGRPTDPTPDPAHSPRPSSSASTASLASTVVKPAAHPAETAASGEPVVSNALQLLMTCIQLWPPALPGVLGDPELQPVLRHCLLGCPVPQIRLLTGVGLMELLQDADPAAVAQLLPLVVSLLPQPGDYTNHCPQYFHFLSQLARSGLLDHEATGDLIHSLVAKLHAHPIREPLGCEEWRADQVLAGLLRTLGAALQRQPKWKPGVQPVVRMVLEQFLFDLPTLHDAPPFLPPKAKTRLVRNCCYDLLIEMVSGCEANFVQLMHSLDLTMGALIAQMPRGVWNYAPATEAKLRAFPLAADAPAAAAAAPARPPGQSFVGLVNQGATCYMNAVVQQLFMIPEFRIGFLACNVPDTGLEPESSTLTRSGGKPVSPHGNDSSFKGGTPHAIEFVDPENPVEAASDAGDSVGAESAAPLAEAGAPAADSPEGSVPRLSASVVQAQENRELFVEFQRMLAFLSISERNCYDTTAFARTYKVGGMPVDVSQQQDANEFLNIIFDKLESVLKHSSQKDLLQTIFGGTIRNVVSPKECSHLSQTEEQFFALSLDIKDKRSIIESLDVYTQCETLEGDNKYFCDKCRKHVTASKRTVVRRLPTYLILHLKRFDFDFRTYRNRKIDDRCEFPLVLDMAKYIAADSTANAGCLYELEGVLVHSGTADSGHYYSFCVDRLAKSRGYEQWCEFNDKVIRPFDVAADLERECFGGPAEAPPPEPGKEAAESVPRVRANNAYMLFYHRLGPVCQRPSKAPAPCSPFFISSAPAAWNTQQTLQGSISPSVIHGQTKGRSASPLPATPKLPLPPLRVTRRRLSSRSVVVVRFCCRLVHLTRRRATLLWPAMPRDIRMDVVRANAQFLAGRYLHDLDFTSFIWSLLSGSAEAGRKDVVVCSVGTKFVLDIVSRSRDLSAVAQWYALVGRLYHKNLRGARAFLLYFVRSPAWKELLLNCPVAEVRSAFAAQLLLPCLQCAAPHETYLPPKADRPEMARSNSAGLLPCVPAEAADGEKGADDEKHAVSRAMLALLELLKDSKYYASRSLELVQVLRDFALTSRRERSYLLERSVITRICFLLYGEENFHSKGAARPVRTADLGVPMAKYPKAAVSTMVQLCAILIRACSMPQTVPRFSAPPTQLTTTDPVTLPSRDSYHFFHKPFFSLLIEQATNPAAILEILIHCCWQNQLVSTNFIELIVSNLADASRDCNSSAFKHHLEVLGFLFSIKDSLADQRCQEVLLKFLKFLESVKAVRATTEACIRWLTTAASEHEYVMTWFYENLTRFQDICQLHGWVLKTR